ncbi:MAG TPA: cytochrome c3 family protein [Ramlibacter sp.]|uniref:cytochrome c3 family protein n=1 Tax=Ramlibacter sp. TaxID=1917967 RepID=UPI002D7F4CE1|nr:cytochrome c3 family protein [Ramlibacter sp.]HET8748194.1 cytochrome c3 family protein [Ramlibacter sp.]
MGWNHWVARATTRKGLGSLAGAIALVAAALIPTLASAQGTPATGIAATKHNLRSGTNGQNKFESTDGNTEICVFCHTPHGADTSASVPLWNRVLAAPASYSTYDQLKTSTLDGKVMAVGSVSLACLSCHDGATAMSTVINAPGSGNYDPAGFTMAGTWSGGNVKATGEIAGGITLIGKDLKNDHPIGIQYAGGGFFNNGGTAAGAKIDQDFKDPQSATLNGSLVWWVDTSVGTAGTRQKTDMILYTRTLDGNDQPFVECASCHDPHSENKTFLRIENTGSAVCLACHTK